MEKKLKGIKLENIDKVYQKCLIWFFGFPRTKVGLSKLSNFVNSSKTATKQAVEKLVKEKIVTREIVGKAWTLLANQKNQKFIRKKIPYNLDKIYESGIVEAVHNTVPNARSIILFGSYRWGDDNEESDIDIAVEIINNKKMEIIKLGIIEQLGYRKNIPVNIHVFSRNNINLNLFSNIANGIVLDGFLETKI